MCCSMPSTMGYITYSVKGVLDRCVILFDIFTLTFCQKKIFYFCTLVTLVLFVLFLIEYLCGPLTA